MKIMDRLFPKIVRKGLYHYKATGEWEGLRLHLKVEENGSGVLVINASRVLFLNKSAVEYIYLFIKGVSEQEAVKEICKRYKIDAVTALNDYQDLLFIVNTFAKTSDICPVSYLGVEKMEPFTIELSAPYRMDLALTYRCNNHCIHCYTGGPRETKELTTEEWFKIIDKLFVIGVPHVTFTGGEPTLREDLPQLVRYAEEKGLVTGLITNGRKLSDSVYVDTLIKAGIDHIQITLESHREEIHDQITGVKGSWKETVEGLKNAIATPVYTLTNTTLNQFNINDIIETIAFIHKLGLNQFACNGLIYSGKAPEVAKDFSLPEASLEPLLTKIRDYARTLNMDFIWYTPTQYCVMNPLQLELGIKSCSACRISMCIEPTGNVIPCQSFFKQLGNILTDDWTQIWNHPICKDIRNRKYIPEKCDDCPQMSICGGGCPLKLQEDGFLCGNIMS
jgi:radical SAM protein with 4Fe4S-binding SPASM domain